MTLSHWKLCSFTLCVCVWERERERRFFIHSSVVSSASCLWSTCSVLCNAAALHSGSELELRACGGMCKKNTRKGESFFSLSFFFSSILSGLSVSLKPSTYPLLPSSAYLLSYLRPAFWLWLAVVEHLVTVLLTTVHFLCIWRRRVPLQCITLSHLDGFIFLHHLSLPVSLYPNNPDPAATVVQLKYDSEPACKRLAGPEEMRSLGLGCGLLHCQEQLALEKLAQGDTAGHTSSLWSWAGLVCEGVDDGSELKDGEKDNQ